MQQSTSKTQQSTLRRLPWCCHYFQPWLLYSVLPDMVSLGMAHGRMFRFPSLSNQGSEAARMLHVIDYVQIKDCRRQRVCDMS